MQGSYFYATQVRKITSKLHKLTNFKSNYTSTMYMKYKYKLVKGDCKPTGRTMLTW